MRANVNCHDQRAVSVYFNGVENEDGMEANEETGELLIACKNGAGKYITEQDAEKGALIHDGIQVAKLKGDVRLELYGPSEYHDRLRQCIEETFVPLVVTVKE